MSASFHIARRKSDILLVDLINFVKSKTNQT